VHLRSRVYGALTLTNSCLKQSRLVCVLSFVRDGSSRCLAVYTDTHNANYIQETMLPQRGRAMFPDCQ